MTLADPARHRLGARAPRHPHRHHRRRRAVRQHLPDPGTNLGARLGFLVALAGLAGWMVADGRHLVDLRHRPARAPSRRGTPCPGAPCSRTPSALYTGRRARARRVDDPRGHVVPRAGRRSSPSSSSSEGWTPLDGGGPGVRPGRRRRPASSSRRPAPSRPASSRPSTCSTPAASASRRSATSSTSSPSATSRTTSSSRSPRSRPTAHRAGPGAGAGRDRRDPPAPVRVHGPRPRRPAPAGGRAHARVGDRSSSCCAGCCTAATACVAANRSAAPGRRRRS